MPYELIKNTDVHVHVHVTHKFIIYLKTCYTCVLESSHGLIVTKGGVRKDVFQYISLAL